MNTQALDALNLATLTKERVCAVKRALRAGELDLVAALDDDRAAPMRIGALLGAQQRWGDARARRLCEKLDIHEHRRVRDLTVRQRDAILRHFNPTLTTPRERVAPTPPIPVGPQEARVVAAILRGAATRAELTMRLRDMMLPVEDLDAAITNLVRRGAITVRHTDGYRLYDVGPRPVEEVAA